MKDEKIHFPARKKDPTKENRAVVRISGEAYNALIEIYNECPYSMAQIASMLILNAAERVVYDKE